MNKWVGIGRLTKDPDIRYSQKGDEQLAVARFTLAVDRKGKDAGTDFISIVSFGKQAEFAEKYLKQGTKMAISGRIQTGSYKNKEGKTVYTTDVIVEEQEFAESKKSGNTQETTPPAAPDDMMYIPDVNVDDLPFK